MGVLYPDLVDDLTGGTQGTVLWFVDDIAAVGQLVAVVQWVAFWFKDPSTPVDSPLALERWADLAATTL